MSFGAGFGAGMGAGMGSGIAIGVAAGKKQAGKEIRDYLAANELTICDKSGGTVDPDTFLAAAIVDRSAAKNHPKLVAIVLTLVGLVGLAVLGYLAFF